MKGILINEDCEFKIEVLYLTNLVNLQLSVVIL